MRAEDRLVERLRELVPQGEAVLLGIGDDAAVLRASSRDTAATTDVLVEGVDFLPGEDPRTIGSRAVAVNLSDLAAVGARPRWFLLTVGFPRERGRTDELVLEICRGAAARGSEYGASLCGGDLSASPVMFVSVAMAGELDGPPVTRSGARPGDAVFLSGATGRAAAGLELLRDGATQGLPEAAVRELIGAYRDPQPKVSLGLDLSGEYLATAAIDVSDGLGVDAARLARASGVRVVLERDRIPIAASLAAFAAASGRDPLELALAGGDDYELLFTAAEPRTEMLARPGVTRIGLVEEGAGAVLRDRSGDRDISGLGWDHVEGPR